MYNQGFPFRKVRERLVHMSLCGRPMGAQAAIDTGTFHHFIYTLNLNPSKGINYQQFMLLTFKLL